MKTRHLILPALLLPALLLLLPPQSLQAGSATWNLNPTTGDWNTAANWTPATIPNSKHDSATFGLSNEANVFVSATTVVDVVTFGSNASQYTLSVDPSTSLILSGAGIVNASPSNQTIVASANPSGISGNVLFQNAATAGTMTTFIAEGNSAMYEPGGFLSFQESASAGAAHFTIRGTSVTDGVGGQLDFVDRSTAANSVITLEGAAAGGTNAEGFMFVIDHATGGDAVITLAGAEVNGAIGAQLELGDYATMGNATVIINGGTNGGGGGLCDMSNFNLGLGAGGTARFEVFGNGTLSVGNGTFVGSIEGDGVVSGPLLDTEVMGVGSNNLSTVFSGTIQHGLLTKVGTGTLTLSGPNTYLGGTVVEGGTLVVTTKKVSGTSSGPVQVNAGTLGGTSPLAGTVTIGSGSGPGAFLSPGTSGTATLTCKSSLTFEADGTYDCEVNLTQAKSDQVVANKGVTIQSGALFSFIALGSGTLPPGTVFTVIKKNGHSPITRTVANLPDGAVLTVGGNNFQASYEGGDGNDLTLTVVP